jgi:putative glutamine amidotransferase
MRPCIGITTSDRGLYVPRACIALGVRLAGGRPLRLRPGRPRLEADLDGLIVGGGSDVWPARYGQAPTLAKRAYDQARDAMEMAWLIRAQEGGLPVLGICRGAQMMNVARGGTLHQQISEAYENAVYPTNLLAKIFYRKGVEIKSGALLSRLLGGRTRARVNSMHKQGVAALGRGLEVTAQEANGVVQAIEDPSAPFHLGVQFHPEFLIYRRDFRGMFHGLIDAARMAAHQGRSPGPARPSCARR